MMDPSTKAAVLVDAGLAENPVDAVCQLVDMGEIGVEEAEVTLAGVDSDPFLPVDEG